MQCIHWVSEVKVQHFFPREITIIVQIVPDRTKILPRTRNQCKGLLDAHYISLSVLDEVKHKVLHLTLM